MRFHDYSFGNPMKATRVHTGEVRVESACGDIASANISQDATKWKFCDVVDHLGFLKHFCKITCPKYPTFPENPNSTYVDEVQLENCKYRTHAKFKRQNLERFVRNVSY